MGLDCSGKTTLLNYLVGEDVEHTKVTAGVNGKRIMHPIQNFNFYDIGGVMFFRKLWKYYYDNNNDAIIYVIDVSDEGRIEETKECLQEVLSDQKLKDIPILIFANKFDLSDCLGPDEIIEICNLYEILQEREWSLYVCSAWKGTGVKDGIKWLLETMN